MRDAEGTCVCLCVGEAFVGDGGGEKTLEMKALAEREGKKQPHPLKKIFVLLFNDLIGQ